MSECAYCNQNGKPTKEHILPKCILERTQQQDVLYLERAKKIIEAEAQIRDVCEQCNSGALSSLDSYICQMFDRYFLNFISKGETVKLVYDFDVLARWLLKVSYNSARAHNINPASYRRLIPFMLKGKPRPSNLAIVVLLAIPYNLNDHEKSILSKNLKGQEIIYPDVTRIAAINPDIVNPVIEIARMVALRSYYFYLLVADDKVTKKDFKVAVKELLVTFKGGILINPERKRANIPASQSTIVDLSEGYFLNHLDIYASYFKG